MLSHANTRFARIYANSLAIASLVSHSLAKRKLARGSIQSHIKLNNKQKNRVKAKEQIDKVKKHLTI